MRKELVIPHYNTLLNIYFFGTTRIAQAHTDMGGSIPPLSGLCFSMTTRNASSVVPPPRSSTFEQAADNKGTGHRESTRSAMTDIEAAEKKVPKSVVYPPNSRVLYYSSASRGISCIQQKELGENTYDSCRDLRTNAKRF